MGQYFDNDINLKENKRLLKLYINEKVLYFESDSGVFSNTQIDYGSFSFLKTLLSLEKVNSILDVGCGYGTLGITLAYFDKCAEVTMLDINEKALELAKSNATLNKITNANFLVSDGLSKVNNSYDEIVINPPIRAGKAIIYKMFTDSAKFLNKNGNLFIVIKKSLGAESAIKKLKEIFSEVNIVKKDKGYYIIKACHAIDF